MTLNTQQTKCMKQKLTALKEDTDPPTITAGTSTSLITTNRTTRQKISKVTEA